MSMTNDVLQIITRAIQEANDKQTKELKIYINDELHGIREDICRERQRITDLEEKYTELNHKYQSLEKSLRKNNIVIFGLEHTQDNLLQYTINKLNNNLQLNLEPKDIESIFTIGKQGTIKPVKVKFTTFLQKQKVLWNCNKLKGTSISISEDLSIEEREEVKKLQKYLRTARLKNLKSFIKGTKLYVSGKKYTLKEIEEKGFLADNIKENEEVGSQLNNKESGNPESFVELEIIEEETEEENIELQVEKPVESQSQITLRSNRKGRRN